MADPQAIQSKAEPVSAGTEPALRLVPPSVTLPESTAESTPESSDDTPTVISKHPPLDQAIQASASHEAFSGGLQGRKLAHFELLEPIGVGGMAAVIRARDV